MNFSTRAYLSGRTVLVLIAILALVALSACAAPDPQPAAATAAPQAEATKAPEAAKPAEKTEIHVVFQTGGDMINATNNKTALESEGITVSTEEIPGESLYEKLMTEFISQSGAYDLVEFYPTWLGGFAEAGYIRPLDDFFAKHADQVKPDDYLQGVQNGATVWRGKRYGIPYDGDVLIFYYRTDLFNNDQNKADFKAKYGYDLKPPETWDEVVDMAEFFDGRDGVKGISTVSSRLWWAVGYWSSVYYSYGGKFVDENTSEILLNREAFNKANEVWLKMLSHAPDGVLNYGYTEAKEALASGKVAMGLQWATTVFLDPRQSPMKDNLGFVVMPGVKQADGSILRTPPLAVGKVLAIPTASKHPEEAFRFGALLSSTAVQVESTVGGTGIDPNRASVFEDARVKEAWGGILPVYRESLKIGVPDIRVPNAAKYYDVISGELHAVWSGTKTSDAAFDAIMKEWQNIVGGK
jgi:multiple sugar transport system substrate-binding protein